ncbi:J domain-containing protein [Pararoseomonas sp. SCSIO 73927]|uniref:J domain-containing protein n=1 Tax=Pararoseomonas sp. SCSIO 73927 TaxID=3114537 RepID=UPI0030CE3CBC
MVDACLILSRLNMDLVILATRSMSETWELLAPIALWPCAASARGNTDLATLGLDRMPLSGAALRSAYRRAAKAAHPDAGGSADAFRAVAEAFGRLARSSVRPR